MANDRNRPERQGFSPLRPGTDEYAEAILDAVQHCHWASLAGMTPAFVIHIWAPHVAVSKRPSWGHAIWAIAAAALELRQQHEAARPDLAKAA